MSSNTTDELNFYTKIYFPVAIKPAPKLSTYRNVTIRYNMDHKSYLLFPAIFVHQIWLDKTAIVTIE